MLNTTTHTTNVTRLFVDVTDDQIRWACKLIFARTLEDTKLVLELRKAVKRIRALIKMLGPLMDQRDYYLLDEQLRKNAQLLSFQRDTAANFDTFQELTEKNSLELKTETILKIFDFLSARIRKAYNSRLSSFDNNLIQFKSNLLKIKHQLSVVQIEAADPDFFILNLTKLKRK